MEMGRHGDGPFFMKVEEIQTYYRQQAKQTADLCHTFKSDSAFLLVERLLIQAHVNGMQNAALMLREKNAGNTGVKRWLYNDLSTYLESAALSVLRIIER